MSDKELNRIKVTLPVLDERINKTHWIHICYLNRNLYLTFLQKMGCTRAEVADFMAKWAKKDFNMNLSMSCVRDIAILKELIRDRYRIAHPNIFLNTSTDRQGWFRIWMTEKMERELKQHE